MRINRWLAIHSSLSRRKADEAIANGRVKVNGNVLAVGDPVEDPDRQQIELDGKLLQPNRDKGTVVLLNKPTGYVCSHNGQGAPTVYDLLPKKYKNFNIAGRLDKVSSGLVLLTNNGALLYELTHPSKNKTKIYTVTLNRLLTPNDYQKLRKGVDISDKRLSTFSLKHLSLKSYEVSLNEGRNRQIRRTFEALGYTVTALHRESLGEYRLPRIQYGDFIVL
jgi:23S rRNA pseudouridine2605 synthase